MSKLVAIVDDSTPFCLLVKQMLEIRNYTVEAYHTASDFFRETTKIAKYDLIIMDINLPDQDGLSVLGKLRSEPRTADAKVLLLSGDSSKSNVIAGSRLGAKDFMTKPIDPMQLLMRVAHLLEDDGEKEAKRPN